MDAGNANKEDIFDTSSVGGQEKILLQAFSGNLDKYSKNAVIQLSKLIFDGHDPRNSQLFQQRYMTNAQVYAILEEQLPKIQRVFSIRQIALLITEHKEHLGKLTWKRSSGDNTKVRSLYALKIVCTRQSINYSTNRTLASLDQILELVDRRTSVNDIQDEKNGEFAGNYFETHGTHNWEEIFNQGKAKGLYKTYSVWVSVKTAYYRFKKQNKKS
ncbi:hypothetical protein O0I10_009483 [Lichtheimia ornata]|uniref:Uncharacterized protein n=1 Tax=Lichtheimia ornata TaxID=688661 RepID=A0AAD7UX77_9FUNG|nr:uncharacterized protein O0I10_009483 [Lichtheimia ornata]KAJ8654763.1 hypothetical protein O0I10_009483 [Lichtheimia ornata]